MAQTTNYGWTMPDVGGSNSVWGTILNTLFQAVDTTVKSVSDVASAALSRAGGTMTGLLGLKTYTEDVEDLGNVSGAKALDLAVSHNKYGTITGDTTFSVSNVPASKATGLMVRLQNGGAFNVAWPATFEWVGGTPPALTAAGRDIIIAATMDGGASWQASALLDVS